MIGPVLVMREVEITASKLELYDVAILQHLGWSVWGLGCVGSMVYQIRPSNAGLRVEG